MPPLACGKQQGGFKPIAGTGSNVLSEDFAVRGAISASSLMRSAEKKTEHKVIHLGGEMSRVELPVWRAMRVAWSSCDCYAQFCVTVAA